MLFYCPNCRHETEVEPRETITTKSGRVAYKANCPVCGQDMAEFIPPKSDQTALEKPEIEKELASPEEKPTDLEAVKPVDGSITPPPQPEKDLQVEPEE